MLYVSFLRFVTLTPLAIVCLLQAADVTKADCAKKEADVEDDGFMVLDDIEVKVTAAGTTSSAGGVLGKRSVEDDNSSGASAKKSK